MRKAASGPLRSFPHWHGDCIIYIGREMNRPPQKKKSNDGRERKMAHNRVDHDTSIRRSEERPWHPEEGEEGEVSSFDQWLDEVTEAADRYFSDRLP